jgi:predicted DCC family thiol-disulfide oxidoreductase YuxK
MIMDRSRSGKDEPAVLLIDGQCLLCSGITRFVAARDKARAFRFAMLQSSIGVQLLIRGKLSTQDLNTFVMVHGNHYYTKSDAALRVFRKLGGWWRILYIFIIVPRAWRNLVYDLVAKNRYRWFGRNDICMRPTPDLIACFLEQGMQAVDQEGIPDET